MLRWTYEGGCVRSTGMRGVPGRAESSEPGHNRTVFAEDDASTRDYRSASRGLGDGVRWPGGDGRLPAPRESRTAPASPPVRIAAAWEVVLDRRKRGTRSRTGPAATLVQLQRNTTEAALRDVADHSAVASRGILDAGVDEPLC